MALQAATEAVKILAKFAESQPSVFGDALDRAKRTLAALARPAAGEWGRASFPVQVRRGYAALSIRASDHPTPPTSKQQVRSLH